MGFLENAFKPISSVFNGVIVHPLDNITSGIGSIGAGIGSGISNLGAGLGSCLGALRSGVWSGVNSLGSGVGDLVGSPFLLIAVAIGGILLLKNI